MAQVTRVLATAASVAAAVAAVRRARTFGATAGEAGAALPGDELLPGARLVTTRAVSIRGARPTDVWPWLVQMGYGRGGWYAVDQLERLIGAGDFLTGGSAETIVPELQSLQCGDRVPMSDRLWLDVATLQAPTALVLALPPGPLAWVWSFTLREAGPDVARLVIRTRIDATVSWVRPLLVPLDAGHLTMELVQLQRIRRRVERSVVA